ncbi:MAG: YCF48-related protein [Ignavibacteriaceae bacterium]
MKKIFTFIAIVLFVVTGLNGQVWRQVTEASYPGVSDMFFINNTTGWFCSTGGAVKKTTDAGLSWNDKNVPGIDDLASVFFIDANVGFTGGKNQKIFKTSDGGDNWTEIVVPQITGEIVAIHFANANTGWMATTLSPNSQILRTTDGGLTWSESIVMAKIILDLTFKGNRGIASTSKLDMYYTHDGINWSQATNATLPAGYTRSDIRGVYFYDDNTAYAVGWGSLIGLQPSIHLKTTDGGVSWQYLAQALENRTYDNLYSAYFKDANNGVALGGASRGTVAVRTTDGGANWVPISIPCGVTIQCISGFGDQLFIGGNSGVLMSSPDFGNSWQLLTRVPSTNLYSISAVSDNVIFTAGFNALFIKTTDGGATGHASFVRANNVSPTINDIFFLNENLGYAAHSYGMLSKTTDGGVTWSAVIKDTNAVAVSMAGVFFLNENSGWVTGKIASNVDIIYKTTDGGATWTNKTNVLAANGRAVHFFDSNKGIVVAEKLKAAYTTDGGETWTLSVFNSLPPGTTTPALKNVIFRDANNAVAVGDNIILLSSDGGATWNYSPVANLSESLAGVDFFDALNGWAVGSKNSAIRSIGLYETSDGGATWTNKVNYAVFDTMTTLYEVTLTPSGYAWVSASSGGVYTTAVANDVKDELITANSFELSQNYPNPFNPTTSIKYSINSGSIVALKVYDILGRELMTLVNEEKTAGNHVVTFNAKDLSSGIYIYTLVTPQGVTSRKMSLIK